MAVDLFLAGIPIVDSYQITDSDAALFLWVGYCPRLDGRAFTVPWGLTLLELKVPEEKRVRPIHG